MPNPMTAPRSATEMRAHALAGSATTSDPTIPEAALAELRQAALDALSRWIDAELAAGTSPMKLMADMREALSGAVG